VANSDVADADGDVISFQIVVISSGVLEKWSGSSWVAVVAGTTLISTGEKLRWTPVANANGRLNAFTVKAYDGALSSATAVQVQVVFNPTSDAPTLSTISTLTGAFEDTAYEITHAALLAASNAADPDGDTLSFKIDAVVTGMVETWDGSSWSPVVFGTTLIAPGGKVRWTPARDANGTIIAFTVKVFDGTLESNTAAQVKVAVAPVNDAPVIYTGTSDTIRFVTGNSNPIIRFAIPASGVTVGDRVRVSYFGQSQISTPLTIADMVNGYIDIQLGAALTLQDGTSDLNTVPVKWIDWTNSTSTTATGTLTTETGTITATLTSTSNLYGVQTNGGGNYFSPTTPYVSPGVAAPTTPDIVQFGYSGDRTLTFSSEVQNLYYAFVSMNGNGYRFDRDFDILSQAITSPGYWGSGEARKIIQVDPVTGATYYNLQCISGEPHGVIRFKGAFTSVSWKNPTTEFWHGFTVGIKTGTSDLQSVTGQFINPSNTVLANLPGLVVQYDATQAGRTGALDATVRSTSILETDAPLSTNGSISMYDIEAVDLVTARVDSVAVSGATSRLTLSNAAIKSFLSATTTDTAALQYAKINWTFNSGTENFNWLGTGEEITFSYTVTADDGAGGTASTTVDITIVGTDDKPTLTTIASITGGTENTPFEITYADLIAAANEADIDNDPWFRVEAVSTGTLAKYDATSSTWIAVTAGTTQIASGDKVRFTPATNANGTINAFTVKAFDGYMASSTAVQVKVVLTAVNDAPTANNATLTTIAEDVSNASNTGTAVSVITAYCTDIDGVAVTGIAITAVNNTNGIWEYSTNSGANWTAISGVSDSSALLLAGNIAAHRVRFRPNANWNGTTTITFRAWDRTTGTAGTLEDVTVNGGTTAYSSGSATGTLTVAAVNDIPVVTGSSIAWTGNTSYSGRFSATDIDSASFTYSVSTNPAHGTVTILGNGFIYMPTDGYVGSDSFAFRAHDGTDYSLPATINFTLAAPPSFTISGGTTVNETPNASISVNFQLSVAGTSTAPMFLDYATAGYVAGSGQGYTATEGLDYTGTSGRLIYQPGDTSSHTFNIPIIDDTIAETAETFALRVTNKPKWIYGPDLNKTNVWVRYVTPATLTGLGSIVMKADDLFELYVNGVQVGSGNRWEDTYTVLADFNGNDVVAIKITNMGGPGSMIGRITIGGVVIGTSAFWKITETAPTGTSWRTDPSFNDSAWSYATEYGDYGVGPWGITSQVIVQNLGSTFSSASNYIVTINPNDNPPSVTGTQTQSFASDLTVQPFHSVIASVTKEVTILDIDIPVENVSVTVTPSSFTSGTLSNLGTGTLTNGVYTVSGTQAAVTAALRGLVFTPSTAAKAAGVVTTTFTIFADDGATHTTTNTATQVTSINLPPVASNPSLYLRTANPTFSITYTDPNGMDAASITTANITAWVGTTQLTIASVVYNPASSTTGTATYTISPPVGGWSSINGKKIDIRLVANQVKDSFGLVMAPVPSVSGGLPLAQILVDTVAPTAAITALPFINIASQAADYVITIQFADAVPAGGLASGMNTATIPSTLVVSETGGSRTVTANRTALVGLLATYKITKPAGSWTTFDGATLSVALPATYADLAGNTGAAGSHSFLIDTTAPTVQYTATRPVTGSNEISRLDMVFSESVSHVDYADLMLNRATNAGTTVVKLPGAVLSSGTSASNSFSLAGFSTNNTQPGGNYSFGFNPASDIVDNVGNPVDQTSTLDWIQMGAALKPSISTTSPLINNLTSVPVTINFGRAVTGFTFSDIVITKNGTPVTGLGLTLTETILGRRFTFNLPTTASATETWNFSIPAYAAVTNDLDLLDTGDSNILEFVVDREPPTEILTPWPNQFVSGGLSNLNNVTYLCTFSDPVKNLPREAITITNGKIVSLYIIEGTDFKKWRLDVKPDLLASGPVTVTAQVRAGAYADVAGNLGVASGVVSVNLYRDMSVKSTLSLNGATLAPIVGTSVTSIPVKVTFTRPVDPTSVTAAAFSVMHSTVGGITVAANGLSATFTLSVVNPTGAWDAPIRVSVLGGVVRDLYGNNVLASAPLSWMHDGTGPSVVLSSSVAAVRIGQQVSVGIKFSELMAAGTFTFPMIQVQLNGVDVDSSQLILKGTGSNFTVSLKPGARGTLTVRLRSNASLATDMVGNGLVSTGNTISVKIS
jgi:VCBS repeat-containing protein